MVVISVREEYSGNSGQKERKSLGVVRYVWEESCTDVVILAVDVEGVDVSDFKVSLVPQRW